MNRIADDPAECITDKGYHSCDVLKALEDSPWKTRISEPKRDGFSRFRAKGFTHFVPPIPRGPL